MDFIKEWRYHPNIFYKLSLNYFIDFNDEVIIK